MFAGSGALGLESLSRGAKKVVLCDNSYDAIRIIKQNIAKTKTENQTIVINKNFEKALEIVPENNRKYVIDNFIKVSD